MERLEIPEIKRDLPVVRAFFALESLDGVGKSTTIKGLEQKSYIVHATPPEEIAHKRTEANEAPLRERFNYYMQGVSIVGHKARQLEGKTQFSDRFLLTTVSAHEAMGLNPYDMRQAVYNNFNLQLPEKTILLTANDDERVKRLMRRGANQNDIDNLKINDQIFEGFKVWADELNHPIVEIDTSDMTPDQVVNEVINITR